MFFYDKTNPSKKIMWPVDYYTDGSDSDAGNGIYVPSSTKVSWTKGVNIDGEAGETYALIVTLVNSKGLRYNAWTDNNDK